MNELSSHSDNALEKEQRSADVDTNRGTIVAWHWRSRIGRPITLWIINLVAASCVVCWLFFDSRFEASVDWWQFVSSASKDQSLARDMGDWWWLGLRNNALIILLSVVTISVLTMVVGLFWGPKRNRSLIAWFALVSAACLWLSLAMSWQNIAWLGKQIRLHGMLDELQLVVSDLEHDWPTADGKRAVLGPFMAYPSYSPGTLILLTQPQFDNDQASISVVEGGDGYLRFELAGQERGDWLEWRGDGSVPTDFVSGLGNSFRLVRHQKLNGNWFLSRYAN